MSRHAIVPLEPLGDRPAVWSTSGDVWQRSGPPGSDSWFCALPPWPLRGLTWVQLCDLSGDDAPVVIERPVLADPAYTTDSIPIVRDCGVEWPAGAVT